MSFAVTWTDLDIIILSEVSQTKTAIWYYLYVKSKKWHKWTYLQNRNRLINLENKLLVTGDEGREGGTDWEFGTDMDTPLYLKCPSIKNQKKKYVHHGVKWTGLRVMVCPFLSIRP